MKKVGVVRNLVAAAVIAAYGGVAAAQEVEPNFDLTLTDPMSVAQPLTIGSDGTVTVTGYLESNDVDVFSFSGRAGATCTDGDRVTAEIVSSRSDLTGDIVDTFLAIHNAAPEYRALTWNDDKDAGAGNYNAYISNYCIQQDGIYYIIVTGAQNRVADGGARVIDGGNRDRGDYTLVISGLSPTVVSETPPIPAPTPAPTPDPTPEPSVMQISIEIKPWPGTVMARINPNARGDIPVALLSTQGFNALEVDENSLKFGHSGDEESLTKCLKRGFDVNRDGRPDKICFFDNRASKFEMTDDKGIVKGTAAGVSFEGSGMLKVIPEKRRKHRHSDRRHDRHDDRDDNDHKKNRR